MKKIIASIVFLWSVCYTVGFAAEHSSSVTKHNSTNSVNTTLRGEALALLTEWMDSFLKYQMNSEDKAIDGGVICPACARIHGRIGDAVLPLMYLADVTGDVKYLNGACRLMKWMENVHRPDGSWMNDVNVSDWNGTTVFSAIALYEALHYHGRLLDKKTREHWEKRLLQAGEFIMNNPITFSCERSRFKKNQNINYQASATYALQAIGEYFGRDDFKKEASIVACDIRKFFTEKDCFLYGEGGPGKWTKTYNGCLPVDLLYNVEESLPNLAYYAKMVNDKQLIRLVETSMNTHLKFMLPDGAWDNSWGTRSFKWTYWGGRTSDGFMGGYYLMACHNPSYYEAIRRNVSLLRNSTHNGLLYAGMHYEDCGISPCIHHTFGHAKAITSFLEQPTTKLENDNFVLPRDNAYGMEFFSDIRTWLFANGPWRATFTGNESEYKVKGTHPMGGALSLLWHEEAGPVFAATMNEYVLIEAPNMQSNTRRYLMSGTPRVELVDNGVHYSNLDDLNTKIKCTNNGNSYIVDVTTHLVDKNQNAPHYGSVLVRMKYLFSVQGVTIEVFPCDKSIGLILPLIASPYDKVELTEGKIRVTKMKGHIEVSCSEGDINIMPSDADERIFNPVPGFSFIPIKIVPLLNNRKIIVNIFNS